MKLPFQLCLTGVFAAAVFAAPSVQATEYTVNTANRDQQVEFTVPDRELPPPGAQRTAMQKWVKQIPVTATSYTKVLQDAQGNAIQCVGVRIEGQSDADRKLLNYLSYEALATSLPMLRLLHKDPKAPAWPMSLGGCTRMDSLHESMDFHVMQLRSGGDIVGRFEFPVYANETYDEWEDRMNRATGTGISVSGNRVFKCASAGWNDAIAKAKPGDKVNVPALCPN